MAHNHEAGGGWSWSRILIKDPAVELARSGFMVPPDKRLPCGSNISASVGAQSHGCRR
jgi:hypothetical protein